MGVCHVQHVLKGGWRQRWLSLCLSACLLAQPAVLSAAALTNHGESYEDQAAGKEIGAEDMEFTLLPVSVTTETVSGYQTSTVYVTKCSPYTIGPTMTRLHTDRARVCFTFSSQEFEQ